VQQTNFFHAEYICYNFLKRFTNAFITSCLLPVKLLLCHSLVRQYIFQPETTIPASNYPAALERD